jgi:hypothetical protein
MSKQILLITVHKSKQKAVFKAAWTKLDYEGVEYLLDRFFEEVSVRAEAENLVKEVKQDNELI